MAFNYFVILGLPIDIPFYNKLKIAHHVRINELIFHVVAIYFRIGKEHG